MYVKIDVTKRHINRGQSRSTSTCPVALAIKSKLKSHTCVDVDECYICIERDIPDNTWKYFKAPKKVNWFVKQFDNRYEVSPFSFSLNIPKIFLKASSLKK